MNTEYQDILNTIQRNPGLTSSEIAEKMEIKGYYRTMKTAEAAEKVSKISDKLRQKGHVISEKIKHPVTGNTVNAWSPVPDQDKEQDHTESNLVMVSENSNQPTEAAMEKPAEYSPEEITQSVLHAIESHAIERQTPAFTLDRVVYNFNRDDNTLGYVEFENNKDGNGGIFVTGEPIFTTEAEVDQFAALLKTLLRHAA